MKVFNSINEIGYEDWLEYDAIASVECDVSNKRRMGAVGGFFAVVAAAAIAGAVLLGGGAAIGLGIFAGLGLLTSSITMFVGFGAANDETQPQPTKEEYAISMAKLKELKRTHQWKKYDKLMRDYWFSQKYKNDREAYIKAQQQNSVTPTDKPNISKTKKQNSNSADTEFNYLDSSNATV